MSVQIFLALVSMI